MSKDNNGDGRKFFLAAAIGALVGLAAGFLTAPKSGKETRKDIKNKATQLAENSEKILKKLYSDFNVKIEELKKASAKLGQQAKLKQQELIKQLELGKAQAKNAISALRAGEAEEIDKVIEDLQKLKAKVDKAS